MVIICRLTTKKPYFDGFLNYALISLRKIYFVLAEVCLLALS